MQAWESERKKGCLRRLALWMVRDWLEEKLRGREKKVVTSYFKVCGGKDNEMKSQKDLGWKNMEITFQAKLLQGNMVNLNCFRKSSLSKSQLTLRGGGNLEMGGTS